MKKIVYIGTALLITSLILAVIWFGWKLALVLFLALTGNNFERAKSDHEKNIHSRNDLF